MAGWESHLPAYQRSGPCRRVTSSPPGPWQELPHSGPVARLPLLLPALTPPSSSLSPWRAPPPPPAGRMVQKRQQQLLLSPQLLPLLTPPLPPPFSLSP